MCHNNHTRDQISISCVTCPEVAYFQALTVIGPHKNIVRRPSVAHLHFRYSPSTLTSIQWFMDRQKARRGLTSHTSVHGNALEHPVDHIEQLQFLADWRSAVRRCEGPVDSYIFLVWRASPASLDGYHDQSFSREKKATSLQSSRILGEASYLPLFQRMYPHAADCAL